MAKTFNSKIQDLDIICRPGDIIKRQSATYYRKRIPVTHVKLTVMKFASCCREQRGESEWMRRSWSMSHLRRPLHDLATLSVICFVQFLHGHSSSEIASGSLYPTSAKWMLITWPASHSSIVKSWPRGFSAAQRWNVCVCACRPTIQQPSIHVLSFCIYR